VIAIKDCLKDFTLCPGHEVESFFVPCGPLRCKHGELQKMSSDILGRRRRKPPGCENTLCKHILRLPGSSRDSLKHEVDFTPDNVNHFGDKRGRRLWTERPRMLQHMRHGIHPNMWHRM